MVSGSEGSLKIGWLFKGFALSSSEDQRSGGQTVPPVFISLPKTPKNHWMVHSPVLRSKWWLRKPPRPSPPASLPWCESCAASIKIALLECTSAQNFRAVLNPPPAPPAPPAEFKLMEREIYSPLELMQIDLYALRRYNSAFIEITELQLREAQCSECLKSSQSCTLDPGKTPVRPDTCLYLSAVLLTKVWRESRGSGFKLISRQSIPIDKDID